ncbi:hypothetical protein LIER_43177 [Lithospermum erythrorhizon]|uniref:Uncharacterized protein n=1 Tax=Lithospermum erythrorhizon TaxID=34254 RepID=A0AAV3PMI2_LITER
MEYIGFYKLEVGEVRNNLTQIFRIQNLKQRLPTFFGGLGPDGFGEVIFRYDGEQYQFIVQKRIIGIDWARFVARAQLTIGIRLLLVHSADRIISVLLFKDGIGLNLIWGSSGLGQVHTGLIEAAALPVTAESEIRRT